MIVDNRNLLMYNDKWQPGADSKNGPSFRMMKLPHFKTCLFFNQWEHGDWTSRAKFNIPPKKHHPQRKVIFKKEHVSEVNGFIRISRQGYILVLASSPKQLNTKDPVSPAFKRRVSVWLLLIYKALLPYYQKRSETWMIHMVQNGRWRPFCQSGELSGEQNLLLSAYMLGPAHTLVQSGKISITILVPFINFMIHCYSVLAGPNLYVIHT